MSKKPSKTNPAEVERAFKRAGCGWILEEEDAEAEKLLSGVAKEIDRFCDEYERRFSERPDQIALFERNPDSAAAFFQTFTDLPLSVEILIAIWRILMGFEIVKVAFEYKKLDSFEMCVVIRRRSGPVDAADRPKRASEEYRSANPWDFLFLRHVGMYTMRDKCVLEGYYPVLA